MRWVNHIARDVLEHVWPAYVIRHEMRQCAERDYLYLPYLMDERRLSLDIGANTGVYALHAVRQPGPCMLFEPNPRLAEFLRRAFGERVTVHQIALSNRNGAAILRIPRAAGRYVTGFGTIEGAIAFDEYTTHEVPTRTLDSLGLPPVGFMKIDVEGHELAVLEGAARTLARDLPTLLIEAEERHRRDAVATVRAFLTPLGYRGYYRSGDYASPLRPIEEFDADRDQSEQGDRYAHNFIFVATEEARERLAPLL